MRFQKVMAAMMVFSLASGLAAQNRAVATLNSPERSEALKTSKDPDFVLRNFRTMRVVTNRVGYFRADEMKTALAQATGFGELGITIVDDPNLADTVLEVGYAFAWDYPFQLRHQNTTMVLLAGKGYGPFSGPLGAASVAMEFVKTVKRLRSAPQQK